MPAAVNWGLTSSQPASARASSNRLPYPSPDSPLGSGEFVARPTSGAFGDEFGAHSAGLRVNRRGIEIGHPVKQAAGADELVERLALSVLFGRPVVGVGAAERRVQGRADDPDNSKFSADTADDFLHARLDRFDQGIAVLAKIVDALEPDNRRDAGQRQHIAVEPVFGRWSTRKRLLRRVFGRPYHLVAADAGVYHGELVAINRMQSAS